MDIPTFDMIMANFKSGQGEESLDTSLLWDDTKEDELLRLYEQFEKETIPKPTPPHHHLPSLQRKTWTK